MDIKSEFNRGALLIVDISTKEKADEYTLNWQNVSVTVAPVCGEYACTAKVMLPITYEDSGYFVLDISAYNAGDIIASHIENIKIMDKKYSSQALTVDPKFVNPGAEALARIEKEYPLTSAAIKAFSGTRLWNTPFLRPLPGGINSQFGHLRTFNGEPRNKHSGIDFAGKTGDRIKAASNGVVVLTGNFYFSGNTVYIDHGQGVISIYMHMSRIDVRDGDFVKEGGIVGLVGATGRVTGPHLHFSLGVQGISVDPMMLFNN